MKLMIPALVVACASAGSMANPLDPRSILKTYFETGDIPTESNFSNLIDSFINLTGDGVEIYDWTNVPVQSSNLAYDPANSDSMSTMNMVIISVDGVLTPGGLAERTLSVQFSMTSSEGIWIADDFATFTSTGSFTFEVTNILRWELSSAPISMSLNGNPGEGTRLITGGTYLETTLLPSPGSCLLLAGGLIAIRRRR